MVKKRSIKVYGQSGYKYRETPTIMLKGQWLKEAGFDIGDYISVTCEDGKLIIAQDAERAAVKAVEAGIHGTGDDLTEALRGRESQNKGSDGSRAGSEVVSMFTTEELQAIDRKYFTVIVADAYDVTLISNNTRHVWYIHNVELKDRNLCLVYHKHKISHPYHSHSRCGTLRRESSPNLCVNCLQVELLITTLPGAPPVFWQSDAGDPVHRIPEVSDRSLC